MGEESLHFRVKLVSQCLVVTENERGLSHPLNHISHREGLARASHTQQNLRWHTILHALSQLLDSLRLVARGLKL